MTENSTSSESSTASLGDDFGRAFVTLVHETLTGAADALGDLDRRAGDGDFGTNVRTAMKGAAKNIDEDSPSTYREWLTALYMGWLGVGGTSGPLFGMFFRDLSKAGGSEGDDSEGDAPTLEQFAQALTDGQATVQKYGEAKVGDKTMIDALDPAVKALRETAGVGKGADEALAEAERAAVDAARATADSTARRGRASYVGDASKGVIDPGAAAMALVIGAARAAVAREKDVDTSWIS